MLLNPERALVCGYAERSLRAARGGDRNLRDVVRTRIDVCNMQMALALTGRPRDAEPATLFTDGALVFPARAAFLEACAATSAMGASLRMEQLLLGNSLDDVAHAAGSDPVRLESAALRDALASQRRASRLDPLGSAPLVFFLLRLQAQSLDLQRLAWGAELGAPAELLRVPAGDAMELTVVPAEARARRGLRAGGPRR